MMKLHLRFNLLSFQPFGRNYPTHTYFLSLPYPRIASLKNFVRTDISCNILQYRRSTSQWQAKYWWQLVFNPQTSLSLNNDNANRHCLQGGATQQAPQRQKYNESSFFILFTVCWVVGLWSLKRSIFIYLISSTYFENFERSSTKN